jgi:muramidase (phage lysozyme)
MTKNEKAFLDMLSHSEGTFGHGDNGYNVIVGGQLFTSYADHPRVLVGIPKLNIKSTAAGRYQLLSRYFDAYKKQLKLPDFSPASQDAIALQQIKECKALDDINTGKIESAIQKCAHIWASLPGAGYGQHENKAESLLAIYQQCLQCEQPENLTGQNTT